MNSLFIFSLKNLPVRNSFRSRWWWSQRLRSFRILVLTLHPTGTRSSRRFVELRFHCTCMLLILHLFWIFPAQEWMLMRNRGQRQKSRLQQGLWEYRTLRSPIDIARCTGGGFLRRVRVRLLSEGGAVVRSCVASPGATRLVYEFFGICVELIGAFIMKSERISHLFRMHMNARTDGSRRVTIFH